MLLVVAFQMYDWSRTHAGGFNRRRLLRSVHPIRGERRWDF